MFKDDELHETRYCEGCLELQRKLQEKEQECEELKKQVSRCSEGWGKAETEKYWYQQAEQAKQEENYNLQMKLYEYKQVLNEIEKFIKEDVCDEECGFNWKKSCSDCDCRYNNIIDIINKAKEK